MDEYVSFVDALRVAYATLVESPELVHDIIDILTPLTSLRERPHLHYIFQLSCLCLTSVNPELPVVELGSTSSDKSNCKIRETIFMVQSYVQQVPDCLEYCTSSASITRFLNLRSDLGVDSFSSVYSPWTGVDFCNHVSIYNSFRQTYQTILRRRSEASKTGGTSSSSGKTPVKAVTVPPVSSIFVSPSPLKVVALPVVSASGLVNAEVSASSKTVSGDAQPSCSKSYLYIYIYVLVSFVFCFYL